MSCCQTIAGAITELDQLNVDLILLDLALADESWLPFVELITDRGRCIALAPFATPAVTTAQPLPRTHRIDPELLAHRVVQFVATFVHRHIRGTIWLPDGY